MQISPVQYTYELRDRTLHSPAAKTVFDELEEALSNHVFLDKGSGPIESDYWINYFLPQIMVNELAEASAQDMLNFRRRLHMTKSIPPDINIFIYSKDKRSVPAFILGGRGRKMISIPVEVSCS